MKKTEDLLLDFVNEIGNVDKTTAYKNGGDLDKVFIIHKIISKDAEIINNNCGVGKRAAGDKQETL